MKIRQIKASLAIVSTGGVRPAAKKLCLTPSTVAKSIGQLESDLGAPLFEQRSEPEAQCRRPAVKLVFTSGFFSDCRTFRARRGAAL